MVNEARSYNGGKTKLISSHVLISKSSVLIGCFLISSHVKIYQSRYHLYLGAPVCRYLSKYMIMMNIESTLSR